MKKFKIDHKKFKNSQSTQICFECCDAKSTYKCAEPLSELSLVNDLQMHISKNSDNECVRNVKLTKKNQFVISRKMKCKLN